MDTLIQLVQEGARRFDRQPALLIRPFFRTRTWRYRDLAATVPRAARILVDAGLGPGDRAILWAVNRPEWGIAFLSIAHAGAVAVPLDVRHTVDFGRKIVAQTGARLVVASRQTEASARELGLPIVWIETLPDLARRAEPLPPAEVTGDDLAEIVFTSGTTGEPKGAMLRHGNLMASATTMTRVLAFGERDRLLSVLPLSHLYEQVLGFIAPLTVGASIVYPVSRQPSVLIRTFRDFRVSVLLIVPQGLRLIDAAIERKVDQSGSRSRFERLHRLAGRLPKPLRRLLFRPVLREFGGRLHTIGVGASALDVDIARRWMDMGVDILQGYGATEMGPVVSFTRPERNVLGTVGDPIPGVDVRIAEDGEIWARGPGRFAGYWQNPAATAAAIDAEGWYHTGDLGAFTPEGMLTFRGRKGVLASIIANAFPLQREGGVRKSLELLGARLDKGYNILIYPEGKLTLGGPLQPFKAGAGLIAVEGATPIVPVKLKIHAMSIVDRRRVPAPLRGDVELVVGEPLWFDSDTDHAAATTRLEAAVAAL
ncbi:MAG: AMP-binding protein [Chloroflexota bacterium]